MCNVTPAGPPHNMVFYTMSVAPGGEKACILTYTFLNLEPAHVGVLELSSCQRQQPHQELTVALHNQRVLFVNVPYPSL